MADEDPGSRVRLSSNRCTRSREFTMKMLRTSKRFHPELERLEDRTLLTARIFVDFGFGFSNGSLTISNSDMQRSGVNGPTPFGTGHELISLTRTVQEQE